MIKSCKHHDNQANKEENEEKSEALSPNKRALSPPPWYQTIAKAQPRAISSRQSTIC